MNEFDGEERIEIAHQVYCEHVYEVFFDEENDRIILKCAICGKEKEQGAEKCQKMD